jgi:hypothetical protein
MNGGRMGLPDTLPCKCSNPSCGITFYARNPVGGGGANFQFTGNTTNCPKCNQTAHYVDWSTDSKGKFQIKGFFSALRDFEGIGKLQTLKVDLEANNNFITAHELADTLVELDPSFEKFKTVLTSIPSDKTQFFIQTIVSIIMVMIMLQTLQSTDENHDESIGIQREQHNLSREQFEYQKEKDAKQGATNSAIKLEQDELKNKIDLLENEFEEKLNKLENRKFNRESFQQYEGKSKLKGNCRNKPCLCGSGIKAKKCHPKGGFI